MSEKINTPPHLWWTLSEPRVVVELGEYYFARKRLRSLPKGDGQTVLVIPGFLSTDGPTRFLRRYLKDMDYRPYGWGLGQHTVFNDEILEKLSERLELLARRSGRKVSIVGWSLGGVVARELAKNFPDLVRSVITLGSPVSGNFSYTPAYKIYTRMNGQPTAEDLAYYDTLITPPPMPTTSIYSKSDGIVAWRNSIQAETDITENIRVSASHFGMAINPDVLAIIADRLAQPEEQWQKYIPPVKKPKRKAKPATAS